MDNWDKELIFFILMCSTDHVQFFLVITASDVMTIMPQRLCAYYVSDSFTTENILAPDMG
jgi:hypothetical protein